MTAPLVKNPSGASCLALLCNDSGVVLEVLRDDFHLSERARPGALIFGMGAPAQREELAGFFQHLVRNGAVAGWRIALPTDHGYLPLLFGGGLAGKVCLVLATRAEEGDGVRLEEELMRINNEQTNLLREVSHKLAHRERKKLDTGGDDGLDDFSRLNNELVNLQRKLIKQNADLARLNEQKNRFLGMAAHDLRSPLGVVHTFSGFLQEEVLDKLDAEQREFLDIIRRTSEFMLQLVNDLLDISAIEAGKLILRRDPVDLSRLVADNVALNRVLASRKNVRLTLKSTSDLPPVPCDSVKIGQVLNNLIDNAVKFSPLGGSVAVTLDLDGDHVRLVVADQGAGIPEEERARLFQPFGRPGSQGTSGERGTGLGLAIVRRIIEGHGGRIGVESEPGRGSTFFFTLPLS